MVVGFGLRPRNNSMGVVSDDKLKPFRGRSVCSINVIREDRYVGKRPPENGRMVVNSENPLKRIFLERGKQRSYIVELTYR